MDNVHSLWLSSLLVDFCQELRIKDLRDKNISWSLIPFVSGLFLSYRSSHNNNYSPTTPIMQHYQKVSATLTDKELKNGLIENGLRMVTIRNTTIIMNMTYSLKYAIVFFFSLHLHFTIQ